MKDLGAMHKILLEMNRIAIAKEHNHKIDTYKLLEGIDISRYSVKDFLRVIRRQRLTILFDRYLDLDVKKGLKRANSRNSNENRFESKGYEFHEKVRKSYLKLASNEPKRIYVIDASKSISDIQNEIIKIVNKILDKK